ncbi:MAG TPA: site-specific integrase [Bacteroidales bacterium]|nr:site-specific integrase [Bacteroidales bacterium]HSA42364.1 site-specific integrase [Bacteroidales bacterium]
MSATFKVKLRQDRSNADGTRSVYLQVIIDRTIKKYPIGVNVLEKNFKDGIISKGDAEHIRKNLLIDKAMNKAKKIKFDYDIKEIAFGLEEFDKQYNNDRYGSTSFYDFVTSQMPYLKARLSVDTIKFYDKGVSKLKGFRAEFNLGEVNLAFLKEYEQYMIGLGNNKNTINSSMSFVKRVLKQAIRAGIIDKDPFKNYPIERIVGNREFLTSEELQVLVKHYSEEPMEDNKKNVLQYFLFCCYTGLRYGDIKNLRFKDIYEVNDGVNPPVSVISIDMHKTGKPVRIPMLEDALRLMPLPGLDQQKVFKVFANQPTNRYLKEIMKKAKIEKEISFHCARHTFATVALSSGIRLDIVGEILGHTDLKTTKIYAKYLDATLINEMRKFRV